MSTEPNRAVLERATVLTIYRLADWLVRFRYYAEVHYANAPERHEGGDDPPVPHIVVACYREALAAATRLASDLTLPEATALASAAQAVHRLYCESWLDKGHRTRLATKWAGSEESEFENASERDWLIVRDSPFGPTAWDELNTAAARFTERLPNCYCLLFELGRTLAEVNFPYPSSYDTGMENIPVFDEDYLIMTIGPRLASLIREVRSELHLLQGVEEWLAGTNPHASPSGLHKRVLASLEKDLIGDKPAVPNTPQPAPTVTTANDAPVCAMAIASASTTATHALHSGEDITALAEMKDRIDEQCAGHVYIGRSLAVLRMFHQIEDLNRRPNESVVLLGPSGAGKTELAYAIHLLSARSQRSFKHIQANDVSGGDAGMVRDKWVGRGRHSGLGKADEDVPVTGWLQECTGGTLFLDELHNLDPFNQQFLRKVMDRKPIPLAAGRGPDVEPDVRLIFATYRNMKELTESRVLDGDFVRRLGNRFITVPSLNDRKDDIPLFVEKFRDGRKPGLGFMLALLLSDWSSGQVAQLIQAIKTAVSRTSQGSTITVTDLAGEVTEEVVGRVTRMPDREVKRDVLSFLKRALVAQGFKARGSAGGLQIRLAELLSVSESMLSRWLKDTGLRGHATPGDE